MIVASVSQVAAHIKLLLESDQLLSGVWLRGEISNLSRPASGHAYFTLKDHDAQLRCALFRKHGAAGATAALQHGEQVLAHGYVSLYEARGDLQFYVDAVQPEGIGVLQAEFERLFAQLEAEGLFAPERKRPLPLFPRRIGLVTSASGAVLHDISTVVQRRWPLLQILLAPTLVQGDGAPDGIITALERLNRCKGLDLIVLARGGGSMEDLWAFNDERVARAIYASGVPVVSAVGHETDYTIADYAADVRAPTPSAAAELIVPDQIEIAMRVGGCARALDSLLQRALVERNSCLQTAVERLERSRPDPASQRLRIEALLLEARRQAQQALSLRAERLDGRLRQLDALSPRATLARGYALVHTDEGRLLRSASKVHTGDRIEINLDDGEFGARIERGRPRAQPARARAAVNADNQARLL